MSEIFVAGAFAGSPGDAPTGDAVFASVHAVSARHGRSRGHRQQYTPIPALCPLPTKHTLDVVDPKSLAREAWNLNQRMLRFGVVERVRKQAEENVVVPAVFREPYAVGKSCSRRDASWRTRAITLIARPCTTRCSTTIGRCAAASPSSSSFFRVQRGREPGGEGQGGVGRDAGVLRRVGGGVQVLLCKLETRRAHDAVQRVWRVPVQCDLPDQHLKYCKRVHVDTLFKAANFMEKAEDKEAELVNKLNDDTALTPIRVYRDHRWLMDAKYVKSEEADRSPRRSRSSSSPRSCPTSLRRRCWTPTSSARSGCTWRRWTTSTEGCGRGGQVQGWFPNLQKRLPVEGARAPVRGIQHPRGRQDNDEPQEHDLRAVDRAHDDPGPRPGRRQRTLPSRGDWRLSLRRCASFASSWTTRSSTLNFTDWLEALARVAELFPLPPSSSSRETGSRPASSFDSGQAAEKRREDDDVGRGSRRGERGDGGVDRGGGEEGGFAERAQVPASRQPRVRGAEDEPLATKLDRFLDYSSEACGERWAGRSGVHPGERGGGVQGSEEGED